MTIRRSRRRWLTMFVVVVLLVTIFIAVFDWDWLRGPAQRMASARTERSVSVGHLHVKLAWPVVIELQDVHVANIKGASPAEMISARKIDISVDVASLFGPAIVIPHVALESPDIHLQRLPDQRTNWTFGKPGEPSRGSVKILGLSVDKGRIEYDDSILDIAVAVQATTGPFLADDSPQHAALTTHLAFSGHYGATPFDGTASTANVLGLQETGKPFQLLTRFRLNKTLISADGSITDLLKPSAMDAQLSVAGPDLAALYPAVPVALPSSPPYRFAGHFTMQDKTYAYQAFKGIIGKSDIAGDARFASRNPRPYLKANLKSRYLDLADLGPMIGLNAPRVATGNADRRPGVSSRGDASKSASTQRVLPQKTFSLQRINAMDADVILDVKKLNVPDELPMEDLYAVLKVDGGKLSLSPLKIGVASGSVVAQIMLDGRQDPIAVDARIDLGHAKLAELFPTAKVMRESKGAVGARIQLTGQGNSIANILATSKGSAQIAMSGGSVSNLMMEEVGLDGGEIIKFLIKGDEQTPIRCAGAAFRINEGVATSSVIVFDTGDTRVDGAGDIDLKNEQFDILLSPEPKDRSILALRVPVRLHGSFAAPGYSLKTSELLLRGGSAVALGFVNPLLALVPLIETGPGTNTDCGALFRATEPAIKDGKTR